MKKHIAMLLAGMMVFSLAACGTRSSQSQTTAAQKETKKESKSDEKETKNASSKQEADDKSKSDETKSAGSGKAADYVSDSFIDPVNDWTQYDDLIAEIKAETDYKKRTELMHKAEDILMSNYCVIPLYYYNDCFLRKDKVKGSYSNLFGTKFFMYASLDDNAESLKIQLASEPAFLDPALSSSVDGASLAANSFSGLYTYDENGKTVPACAESYEVTDDGLTYTVKLKDGLKWSDGTDLTAADFEYSWKRATNPETAADYAYMYSNFDGYVEGKTENLNVKASEDGKTLTFVLSAPCAYIEDLMAFPVFFPVQKAWVEANSTPESPGAWCNEAGFPSNGAYKCIEWNHDTSMVYEKNPNWYNADKVKINKLEFMLSADDTAVLAAYNDGSIDYADTVAVDEIASLIDRPDFYIEDQLGTYYIAFNATSKLFDGKTPEEAACMREAFSLLIDRDYIAENVGQTGQKIANSYIPIGMADGNGGVFKKDENANAYYDAYAINNDEKNTIEKAIKLLEAAGFKFDEQGMLSKDTPISIEYLINENTGHKAIAESIQQDFGRIGINMTIQTQDWNVFLEERKSGNFDIAREGWVADFNDPINMLEMFITDSGNNDCQYGRKK